MRFIDRFKRKTAEVRNAPIHCAPADSHATTTADRPDFTLSLPFRWEALSDTDGYEFRNQTLPEQIIISVLRHQKELTKKDLATVVTGLVNARRKAIGELSRGKAQLGEMSLRFADEQIEARVIGEDSANQVRIAFAIRATPRKSVTVALHRYTLRELDIPFADYAGVIFDLFKVKDT